MKATDDFYDLLELVGILRKECPWDRKQTHESIKDNLIEEAYEAVEAIDDRNFDELRKELGDLLLHVIFQTIMATESDSFTIEEVIYSLQEKLIRRHPHVFEDVDVNSEEEVAQNWEAIKMKEGKKSVLEGIPKHLPALIRAQRMQEKASNIGFDWPESDDVWEKVEEELAEFKSSINNEDKREQEQEFGDLLFSLVNMARYLGIDAEDSLRLTNRKFKRRFSYIEEKLEQQDQSLQNADIDKLDQYWEEAKNKYQNGNAES
jgi:XTP/dITP diphosphohydrolase